MGEYKGLRYKTVNDVLPHDKAKVYFTCHPDDFDRYFTEITGEIFEIERNIAFWYRDPSDDYPPMEGLESELDQMHLIVIPITRAFIMEDNKARKIELAYAIEKGIPVLPLLQEPNLTALFNEVCGGIQYIDKYDRDPTTLPYEEKLKKRLLSVIVGDELSQKVRAAFDSYIFLSYRKKDRKYAQKIMHLIHENEFCRDIAIWYDEFLTPGEQFEEAIVKAMENSSLFAMAVTPRLLEDGNWVLTNEYPAALDMQKQFLPIEADDMQEHDLVEFHEKYNKVGEIIKKDNLSKRLYEMIVKIAREENNDPRHLFFIGLAYLNGIDVEVNRSKGLELITKAAEGGLADACKKLVNMYENGDGVKRNNYRAAELQEEFCVQLEEKLTKLCHMPLWKRIDMIIAGESMTTFRDFSIVSELHEQGHMWRRLGKYGKALECYQKALEYQKQQNQSLQSYNDNMYWCLYWLEIVYKDLGLIAKAKEYCLKRKTMCIDSVIKDKNEYMADIYDDMAEYEEDEYNYEKASTLIQKGISIYEQLLSETKDAYYKLNLARFYSHLGSCENHNGNFFDSVKCAMKGKDLLVELINDTKSDEYLPDLADSYMILANILDGNFYPFEAELYKKEARTIESKIKMDKEEAEGKKAFYYCDLAYKIHYDDPEKALELYKKAAQIQEQLWEEYAHIINIKDLRNTYDSMIRECNSALSVSERKDCYKKKIALQEKLFEITGISEHKKGLLGCYRDYAQFCNGIGNLDEAIVYYDKVIKIEKSDLENASGYEAIAILQSLANVYSSIAAVYETARDKERTSEYNEKHLQTLELIKNKVKDNKELERKTEINYKLINIYQRYGDGYFNRKEYPVSLDYYCKAEKVLDDIKDEYPGYNREIMGIYEKIVRAYEYIGDKENKQVYLSRIESVSKEIHNEH